MRIPRKYLLGGAAVALLVAGVAEAATAKLHTINVDAPNGQVVEVHYTGDVAPQVRFVPVAQEQVALPDPFAEMEHISAVMDAQMHAMMQRAALLQQAAASGSGQATSAQATPGQATSGLTMVGQMPEGTHVTYYSSSTDANGCTRSVSYSSDGASAQPRVTQASSDACDAATSGNTVTQAKAVVADAAKNAPGHKA
jgi:cellobiose-specific phosphotransferase system component IIB